MKPSLLEIQRSKFAVNMLAMIWTDLAKLDWWQADPPWRPSPRTEACCGTLEILERIKQQCDSRSTHRLAQIKKK